MGLFLVVSCKSKKEIEKPNVKPNVVFVLTDQWRAQVNQIVPSVKGNISVEVNKSKDTYSIDLISPEQTTAIIYVPKEGKKVKKVLVNGENVWKNDKYKKTSKSF